MNEIILIKYQMTQKGGLEKQFWKILKVLINKNYTVTILTASKVKKNHPNVIFQHLPVHSVFKFLKIKKFDQKCSLWIKKSNAKIVLSFDRTSHQSYMRLGNGIHKAYLNKRSLFETFFKTFINIINPLHKIILSLEKKAFSNSFLKTIIVNSNMVKNEVIKYYSNKNIKVVHNGVELNALQKPFIEQFDQKNAILKKFTLPQATQILFVGNDFKRKGLKILILALARLKNKNFHLCIVGKDKHEKKYKKLVEKLKLNNKITFFGPRQDVIKFYQIADLFVLPTYYDPFANTTIEAIALGNYTITSKNNGASEIINEKNGYVLDNLNINCLFNCLSKVIKHKKSKKNAEEIRNTINNLEITKQLDKLISILK